MATRGPKTESGKAIVALNAVRHGMLSSKIVVSSEESADEFEALLAALMADLEPEGSLERQLVGVIAISFLRLGRIYRHEAGSISRAQAKVEPEIRERGGPLAEAGSLSNLERSLEAARERFSVLVQARSDAQDAPIQAATAVAAIELMAGSDNTWVYVDDDELPAFADRLEFSDWSLRLIRKAASTLAHRRELLSIKTDDGVMEQEIVFDGDVLDEAVEAADVAVAKLEADVEPLVQEVEQTRRERAIPHQQDLTKLARYEAQVSNQLYKALHELEARQARRRGEAAPLARFQVHGLK